MVLGPEQGEVSLGEGWVGRGTERLLPDRCREDQWEERGENRPLDAPTSKRGRGGTEKHTKKVPLTKTPLSSSTNPVNLKTRHGL